MIEKVLICATASSEKPGVTSSHWPTPLGCHVVAFLINNTIFYTMLLCYLLWKYDLIAWYHFYKKYDVFLEGRWSHPASGLIMQGPLYFIVI